MRGPTKGIRGHGLTVAITVSIALSFALWLLDIGGGLPSLGRTYGIRALLPTAASLTTGARVTMAGVQVGSVTSVQRQGLGAVVGMQIEDRRVTPLPADSRIELRQHTPVGENYVSIQPGSSRSTLASGGVLAMSQAGEYVDVDQILSTLQGQTRQRARQLIESLGSGLQNRGGRLNTLLGETSRTLQSGSRVVHVLSGDRAQVSQLVARLGDIAAAIGGRQTAIKQLALQALTSFQAIAGRDRALRVLLDQLPATLAQVRTTSDTLASVTNTAAPVIANLGVAVGELRPAVRLLAPAATEGDAVVRALGTAAPPLQTTLGRLRSLAAPASAALPALLKTVCQVNPMLRYLQPYLGDVAGTLVNLGSVANSYDATGHALELTPVISNTALAGLPAADLQAAQTLEKAGLLGTFVTRSYDPYPPPGQAGKDTSTGKNVIGPEGVPATGYRYPHILADC